VLPVKYEQGFYIQEDDILHSRRYENLKSFMSYLFTFLNVINLGRQHITFVVFSG
jgi:hypothetical protein